MEFEVAINQIGYGVYAKKVAFSLRPMRSVHLVEDMTGAERFRAGTVEEMRDPILGRTVYQWDFSRFGAPGQYRVVAEGAQSASFGIGGQPYRSVFSLAMRSYLCQRCGIALNDPVSGVHHPVCHQRPARTVDTGEVVEVSGGWHDAGDYGRYTQTAGVTVGQILMLAELAPRTVAGTDLSLPDGRTEWSDTWTEVAYELDWMFKMQRSDGAVYHKVNTDQFCAMVLPQDDVEPLIVYDVATPDTGIFAGAMARAARVWQPLDSGYAKKALHAAVCAWDFLSHHQPLLNPKNGQTGAYSRQSDADERLWAAAELWLATGDIEYERYVDAHWTEVLGDAPGFLPALNWEHCGVMVPIAMALDPNRAGERLLARAQERLVKNGERLLQLSEAHGFGVVLAANEYRWASAKAAVAHGINLALAHRLTQRNEFLDAALAQWNFVLGCNALCQSWLTGAGEGSTRHPHHRYVSASGILIPGLLVGGANAEGYRQDHVAPNVDGPMAYVDRSEAFAVNENAIDYNAPLVVLSAYLHETLDQRESPRDLGSRV